MIATLAGAFIAFTTQAGTSLEANSALTGAAKAGDLAAAERALQGGADPNCRVAGTWLNFTPLLQAISEGQLEVAKLLLDRGADPYLEDENGDPAMVFAADKKHEAIARLLIARGVLIDSKNSEGLTALTRQISYASAEDIQVLLELGADPNQRGKDGETPLIMLTKVLSSSPESAKERTAAIRLLIEHGVDVNATDDFGASALLHAVENGTRATMETLVRAGADVNRPNTDGSTPLMVSLSGKNDNEGVTDYLISQGADVKMRDGKGVTTLMMALKAGRVEAAARLIKQGVEIKERAKDGTTAAHAAASFGGWAYFPAERAKDRRTAVELLRMVSAAGGDLEAADAKGYTPLLCAVAGGHVEAVEFLLSHGSDPNRPNSEGETPLMLSITSSMNGFAKMKLLHGKGALLGARNGHGQTALMIAARTMNKGALMYLLRRRADADVKDPSGATALSLLAANAKDRAVNVDYARMIRALAASASSVNQSDAEGMTPLMWAAISDLPEAVTPLLQKNADINARSRDGRTAWMWAVAANAEKTVPLLRAHGADVEAKDTQGRTALDWARMLGLPIAKMLEAK